MKAPGLRWEVRSDGSRVAVWRCSKPAARKDYPIKTQRLWVGATPTDQEIDDILNACGRLQREMKDWLKDKNRKRPSARLAQKGEIYFIASGRKVKIGFTTKIKDRIASLQTGCPDGMKLIGTLPATLDRERMVHAQFASLRRRGEWFDLTGSLSDFLASRFGWTR